MTENTRELTESDRTMRMMLAAHLGGQIGGDKSLYDVLEWEENPTVSDFYATYKRNPYAGPVVEAAVNTSWRDPPEISDEADTNTETSFETELEDLIREHRLWNYCKRDDILAGIGEYGILVLELSDAESITDFENEVEGDNLELNGIRVFSQESVEDVEYGKAGSGRWGEPVTYELDLSDEDDETNDTTGPSEAVIHHSRVIHIPSDGLLDDEVRGTPRQEPVYNVLTDIEKTLGSSAEVAYRASAYGLNVNVDKDFSLEDGGEEMDEQIKRWYYDLDPILQTQGADVNNIGGEQINPGPVIDPEIEALSARTGIPQSVLKGNETGERSTTQDLKEWYGKVQERRESFVTPLIVRALIDKLVEYGIISEPQGGSYGVDWPPLAEESSEDIAQVELTRAQVLNKLKGTIPSMTTEQRLEYVEDGEFPDELDTSSIEPADVEELQRRAQQAQQQTENVPPTGAEADD